MKKAFLGALLISIILCPMHVALPSISPLQPRLLAVQEKVETETLQVFNETVLTSKLTRIEEWTNGTLLQMVFHHILDPSNTSKPLSNATYLKELAMFLHNRQPREYYGIHPPPREVIITYKKWVTNTSTPEVKTTSVETSPLRPMTGLIYPYIAERDGRQFVLKGSYGNVFATYDHNDNYNSEEYGGVYPLQANTAYILPGNQKPYHIHLTKNLLDSWVMGNLSEALAITATFLITECVKDLAKEGLEALSKKVAAILGSPIIVAVLLIWDIVEAINTLLKILGLINQAQWVENVVREHFLGDGWTWRGPIISGEFIGFYWCPFWFKPIRGRGYFQWREFNQTWGAEGIFGSSHEYSIVWLDRIEWDIAPTSATIDGAGRYFRTSPWG